jgi:hypothetical protein
MFLPILLASLSSAPLSFLTSIEPIHIIVICCCSPIRQSTFYGGSGRVRSRRCRSTVLIRIVGRGRRFREGYLCLVFLRELWPFRGLKSQSSYSIHT